MSQWLKEFMAPFAHVETKIVKSEDPDKPGVYVWFRAVDPTRIHSGVDRNPIQMALNKETKDVTLAAFYQWETPDDLNPGVNYHIVFFKRLGHQWQ